FSSLRHFSAKSPNINSIPLSPLYNRIPHYKLIYFKQSNLMFKTQNFKLRTSNFKLPTSLFALRTSNFVLQTSYFPPHETHVELQNTAAPSPQSSSLPNAAPPPSSEQPISPPQFSPKTTL